MGFFELLGLFIFLYYLVNLIFWIILDSDIELFLKEKFGKPISSLKGKVVWVTGASSGIGKHLALVLAKNNVKLCLSARRLNELEKVKEECLSISSDLTSKDILVLQMDMLEISEHQENFNRVLRHFGQLDVLVNNAGRSQRAFFKDIDLNVDREMFELDVFSIINLSRIYARHVEKTGANGHVAVTSSSVGLIAVPNSASYTAAKHAIHGYFETLKLEMPEMKVTIFCPGPTSTEFLQNAFTAEQGKNFGEGVKPMDVRMTADRCAYLMATAIANKTYLNFVGPFPVPFLLYISCYYPNLKLLVLKILGKKGLQKIRDSNNKN